MKRSSKPRNPPSRSDDEGKSSLADKIRILIADDHTTVLAGLASIIGMQPDMLVVAEAANGRQAVDLWRKHRPDVTLLDLRMPLPSLLAGIPTLSRVAAWGGGFPIKVNGEVVGAIGLSGVPAVQNDVDCARAALALVPDAGAVD